MSHAAVSHLPRNFRNVQFVVYEKFFNAFNLMFNVKMFDRDALRFREEVRQVSIIMVKFCAEKLGKIDFQRTVRIMYLFNYYIFDALHQNAFLVIH